MTTIGAGKKISTAFVGSTVDQAVSKHFVRKQQTRWSERGAHVPLQIRTQTLNSDLRTKFRRWCPALKDSEKIVKKAGRIAPVFPELHLCAVLPKWPVAHSSRDLAEAKTLSSRQKATIDS